MEEFLIVILQAMFEIVWQSLFYFPFDLPSSGSGRKDEGLWGWLALFVVVGTLAGILLTLWQPHVLLPFAWLRIVNLVLGPVLAGSVSYWLAKQRQKRDECVMPWKHFAYASAFTTGVVTIRFIMAAR